MKFVDSANITVIAGNGGDGCISFYKKKGKNNFLRRLDSSNGGDGGDVYLLSDVNMNTLNVFRYNRIFRAGHGFRGRSRNCTGKKGKDLLIKVPVGTRVYVQKTNKLLGDMINYSFTPLMVAKGGHHGSGNKYSKYFLFNKQNMDSVYHKKIYGMSGELQHLQLELIMIADVGLFGLPNSGKSSFISMVSNAKPKIAHYPFTTLIPNLGTVQMDSYGDKRFVIADIPGIIRGASRGLGLGIRFLKHLERCRMLLHFVDISPSDNSNPIENILSIEQELNSYNDILINKTRWLIFNKIDLLSQCMLKNKIDYIIKALQWKDRYYSISVIDDVNVSSLCYDIMQFINHNNSFICSV